MGQVTTLAFVLALLRTCLGLIVPDTQKPVWALCTNAQCVTTYYFSMTFTEGVDSDAFVSITFPPEFTAVNLGILQGSQECFSSASNVFTQVPCDITNDSTVSWSLGAIKASSSLSLSLSGVHNPDSSGGTGFFKVVLFRSGYDVSHNDAFARTTIDDIAATFSSASLSASTLVLNKAAVYFFKLVPSVAIPAKSIVRVKFPATYTLAASNVCVMSIFNPDTYSCGRLPNAVNTVEATSTAPEIPAQTSLEFSISGVINPSLTGATDQFFIEVFAFGTYKEVQRLQALRGVVVEPGAITNTEVTGGPLMQTVEAWYIIRATTTNPIPSDGYIRVQFPAEFQGLHACLVISGLVGPDGTSFVPCDYLSEQNVAIISGFNAVAKATSFRVTIRASNPNAILCSQFSIMTQLNNLSLIDKTTAAGGNFVYALLVKESDLPTSTTLSDNFPAQLDLFLQKEDLVLGEAGPLELFVQCKSLLPLTPFIEFQAGSEKISPSTRGQIVLNLPPTIELVFESLLSSAEGLSCLFGKNRYRAMVCSWDNVAKRVTIETPETVGLEECPLSVTITVAGDPSGGKFGFRFPTAPYAALGQNIINIQTWIKKQEDESISLREEADLFFIVPPKLFTSPEGVEASGSVTFNSLHTTRNYFNVFWADILTSVSLPAGSGLEFEFDANGAFAYDLGYSDGGEFPCVSEGTWGGFTTCYVVPGTSSQNAFIQMKGSKSEIIAGTSRRVFLPKIKNGSILGAVQTITVRTVLATTEAVEYQVVTLSALTEVAYTRTEGFSGTLSDATVQLTNSELTLKIPAGMNVNDFALFEFAKAWQWPDTPDSWSITRCAGFEGTGNYWKFSTQGYRGLLFQATQKTATSTNICFTLPRQMEFARTEAVTAQLTSGRKVVNDGAFYLSSSPASVIEISVSVKLSDAANTYLNEEELYQVQFKLSSKIRNSDSVSILFPDTVFSQIGSNCFRIVNFPAGSTCQQSDYTKDGKSYRRMKVSGMVSDATAVT